MLLQKFFIKSKKHDYTVAPGITGLKIVFVNVYMVSQPDKNS